MLLLALSLASAAEPPVHLPHDGVIRVHGRALPQLHDCRALAPSLRGLAAADGVLDVQLDGSTQLVAVDCLMDAAHAAGIEVVDLWMDGGPRPGALRPACTVPGAPTSQPWPSLRDVAADGTRTRWAPLEIGGRTDRWARWWWERTDDHVDQNLLRLGTLTEVDEVRAAMVSRDPEGSDIAVQVPADDYAAQLGTLLRSIALSPRRADACWDGAMPSEGRATVVRSRTLGGGQVVRSCQDPTAPVSVALDVALRVDPAGRVLEARVDSMPPAPALTTCLSERLTRPAPALPPDGEGWVEATWWVAALP